MREFALKDVFFSDIIYNGAQDILVRNLKGMPTTLAPLPNELKSDAKKLYKVASDAEGEHNEFFVFYDGVPYRATIMETLAMKVYALRRPFYPVPPISSLGYTKALVEALKAFALQGGGLFIMSGATGSGKTTTIYSLLQYYIRHTGDILVSLEDPPEIPMQGVYNKDSSGVWYQIDTRRYGGYEQALIASMRYNPRYILLGEIRDPSVAHWALRAAVNGHVVMTTIHGGSVTGGLLSLLQTAAASAYSNPELAHSILADGLSGIMSQRLVKKNGMYRPVYEVLFPGYNHGIRAKIRAGKFEMLSTEIEMQNMAVTNEESLLWIFDPDHPRNNA